MTELRYPKPSKHSPRPRVRIRRGNDRSRVGKGLTRTSTPRRERKSTVGALKRKLWRLFAAYVKQRDGNVCFTCGASGLEGLNWHAGHCVPQKGHAALEYDPKNVHSQCGRCNLYERGNVAAHVTRIIQVYGISEWNRIMSRARLTHCWKAHELRDLISALERGGADYECLYYERYL